MSKKVRLGILGIGNMGSSHATKLVAGECPEIELTAVCDVKPERLEWAKENLGEGVARFATAEEMMDSGVIDALVVAVPHYDHPKYSIMAMKRGLHVLTEKPAGVYTKQVLEMNAVADECNVVFALMMNQRTNCIYRKMREIMQSGELGEIRRTNWLMTNWYRSQAYYDSGDWRATWSGEGGGVLMNQCPHQLDLWQWICGMPVKVQTNMHFGQWHDIEVEDDVTTYVEYADGATGVFVTTTGDGCGSNRFEIQMDKAKLVAENDKLTVLEFSMSEPEFTKTNKIPFGHVETTELELETDGLNPQHIGVLNAWAGAILRGTPLVARGEEGINGVQLSNAMHMSAFTGKAVELPVDEDAYYEELMKRVATSRRKENVAAVFADTSDTYGGSTKK